MHEIELLVGLMAVVCILIVGSRKLDVPYPILLVIGGLLLSLIPGLPRFELDPEYVFALFLPPLLCAAAWKTSWREFKANLRPIALLAIGLVFATTFAVAAVCHWVIGLPWALGCVLGAIISPPDAVAAAAITERLGVPRRITVILEGESLVNDASGLVAYRLAVAAVTTGMFSLPQAGAQFLLLATGGITLGLVLGWIITWIHRQIDDTPVEITMTLLMAFGSYILAERLQVSGVLAVVTLGLYHRWQSPGMMSPATRTQAIAFWEMIEFLLNGLVFILIGLQLPAVLEGLAGRSIPLLLGYGAMVSVVTILVRLAWVFPAAWLPRLLSRRIRERDPLPPWQALFLIGWTGMRGVVSLAAALALPLTIQDGTPFAERDLILFLTFSVILVTLILQGLSLPGIIAWLGLAEDDLLAGEERLARQLAARAAIARLDEHTANNGTLKPERIEQLRVRYLDRLRCIDAELSETEMVEEDGQFEMFLQVQKATLGAERQMVVHLRNEGTINDEVLQRLEYELDLEELRLGL